MNAQIATRMPNADLMVPSSASDVRLKKAHVQESVAEKEDQVDRVVDFWNWNANVIKNEPLPTYY